jgi:hypothetical protein
MPAVCGLADNRLERASQDLFDAAVIAIVKTKIINRLPSIKDGQAQRDLESKKKMALDLANTIGQRETRWSIGLRLLLLFFKAWDTDRLPIQLIQA